MIDIIVDEIIGFITNEVSKENHLKGHLVKWFKKSFNEAVEYTNPEHFKLNLEKYLNWIKELEEVRKIYQKGKVFVKNQTKGKKKGLLSHWYEYCSKENAEEHLDYIKRLYSERTYYRHKKKLRELGLIS